MTTLKPTEIREFELTFDNRASNPVVKVISKEAFILYNEVVKVIEYRAVEQLKAENEDLKNTLNGIKNCKAVNFVVYHPVKNPDADNIFETINKLREQVNDYEQALKFYSNETTYLNDSTKNIVEYIEGEIQFVGTKAREVLKKWGGV